MTEHRIKTYVDDQGRLVIPPVGVEHLLAELLAEVRGLRADLDKHARKATSQRSRAGR